MMHFTRGKYGRLELYLCFRSFYRSQKPDFLPVSVSRNDCCSGKDLLDRIICDCLGLEVAGELGQKRSVPCRLFLR